MKRPAQLYARGHVTSCLQTKRRPTFPTQRSRWTAANLWLPVDRTWSVLLPKN